VFELRYRVLLAARSVRLVARSCGADSGRAGALSCANRSHFLSPRTACSSSNQKRHDLETCWVSRAAPAVLVPERFRMKHALPLRWMPASRVHLSSVGWTFLQYFEPERSWEFAPSVEPSRPLAGPRLALLQNRDVKLLLRGWRPPMQLNVVGVGAGSMPGYGDAPDVLTCTVTRTSISSTNTNAFSATYRSVDNPMEAVGRAQMRQIAGLSWCSAHQDGSSSNRREPCYDSAPQ
jgi:hypothetical protein